MSKKHYADRNLKFETLQLHVGSITVSMRQTDSDSEMQEISMAD